MQMKELASLATTAQKHLLISSFISALLNPYMLKLELYPPLSTSQAGDTGHLAASCLKLFSHQKLSSQYEP